MNQWPGKYGRSSATFKDQLNATDEREGLWGGHLPIISFQHTIIGPPPNGPYACQIVTVNVSTHAFSLLETQLNVLVSSTKGRK